MRAVLQRVVRASVEVDGRITGEIERGLLVLIAVANNDSERDAEYLAQKIAGLRIFADGEGRMNRSVVEAEGAVLVVSQFTLYAETKKGMRPSFDRAAAPEVAERLYEHFVFGMRKRVPRVETGVFRASMAISLINDGPVTIICDSPAT